MINQESTIQELRLQVEKYPERTEIKCASLLKEIASVLLHPTEKCYYINSELSTTAGRLDIVVIATSISAGITSNEAYIWELKAPQLKLFELECDSRACPTKDLYQAENQLLHYHKELKGNIDWQDKWDLRSHNVKLGGIIIGRDNNLVKCVETRKKYAEILAKKVKQIREEYLYHHNQITLLTWDDVLRWAEIPTASHQQRIDTVSGTTDLFASLPSIDLTFPDGPLGFHKRKP
jgi:hypothetical protein